MRKFCFYNTLKRDKQEFISIDSKKVGIYSCGPTVYSTPHIGNMYAYICWDVLVRALRYAGYEVKWVMNLTDVGHLAGDLDGGEDKMEKAARTGKISIWDVAKKYTEEFFLATKMLNIITPDIVCKATDHIAEQIALIQDIEKKGFTYVIEDGVYFDTGKFKGYGDFAHIDVNKLKEGARVEVNDHKKNPSDFSLWKFSPKDEKRQMEWESPWGLGFPGWHIECTAMSIKYLGRKFDIHTGGIDHIPIHHTNEIAQSYGAFGEITANYWLHNAFITNEGKKISKSTGGLFSVPELQSKLGFDPIVYRYLAISTHYRKGLDFSIKNLESAKKTIENIKVQLVGADQGRCLQEYINRFGEKIADDLAMPEAMAVVHEMLKSKNSQEDKLATWQEMDKVLGLNLDLREEVIPGDVQSLAEERMLAKKNREFAKSDLIRDKIREMGYTIEDTESGYIVKKISV